MDFKLSLHHLTCNYNIFFYLQNACGKKAPTSVGESVGRVMKHIYCLGEDRNGHLIDYEGKDIPW
jgi:hypothetical protein